jgi:hypothetical protein
MWFDIDPNSRRLYVYQLSTLSWIEVKADDTHSFVGAGAPTLVARPDLTTLIVGDIYIDNTTEQGYYWDGVAWVLFGADTHAFLGAGDPIVANPTTTRPSGTALQAGDIYIDTVSQQGYYYNTGTSTWNLFGSDSHSFTGVGAPTLTTRPNGTTLAKGDQYVNETNNALYYWDGAQWEVISNDTHSITGNGDPTFVNPVTLRPDGTVLQLGDQYVDLQRKHIYSWTGALWLRVSDYFQSFIGAGAPTLTIRPDFTALFNGDQYIDTNTHTLYYWNGAAWIVASNDTHAFVGTDPVLQIARNDGTALQVGDMFVDSDSSNRLYYWDGAAWSEIGGDTNSQLAAGPVGPLTRANGTPLESGDQWVDTADGYKIYVWDLNAAPGPTPGWVLVSAPDTHSFVSATEILTRPDGTALLDGDQLYLTTTDPWTLKYWDSTVPGWVGGPMQPMVYDIVDPVSGTDTGIYGTVWNNTATGQGWELVEDPAGALGLWKPLIQEATIQIATVVPTTQGNGLPLVDGDIYFNPTTGLSFIYNTATSTWVPFGSDTHSILSATAPAIRPSGGALQTGDTWVDTDYAPAISYYRSAGGAWLPNGDVSTVVTLPAVGEYANQILVNSTNNRMYRFDGTAAAWVQVM